MMRTVNIETVLTYMGELGQVAVEMLSDEPFDGGFLGVLRIGNAEVSVWGTGYSSSSSASTINKLAADALLRKVRVYDKQIHDLHIESVSLASTTGYVVRVADCVMGFTGFNEYPKHYTNLAFLLFSLFVTGQITTDDLRAMLRTLPDEDIDPVRKNFEMLAAPLHALVPNLQLYPHELA